jgi:hypothetical protein
VFHNRALGRGDSLQAILQCNMHMTLKVNLASPYWEEVTFEQWMQPMGRWGRKLDRLTFPPVLVSDGFLSDCGVYVKVLPTCHVIRRHYYVYVILK